MNNKKNTKFEEQFKTIDKLRKFRNKLVHDTDNIKNSELVNDMMNELNYLKDCFKF